MDLLRFAEVQRQTAVPLPRRPVPDEREPGVFSLLVWQGTGTTGGAPVAAGDPANDELPVTHDRAVRPLDMENTGDHDLLIIKIFSPDINSDSPAIERLT
ncbi:hypothetical protein GCM10023317_26300 [Actinopolymorpha pittospori]